MRGAMLTGLVIATVVPSAVASAWAATPAPSLSLSAQQATQAPRAVELVASLEEPTGSAAGSRPASLAGVSVSFSVHLQQFAGAPLLALGSATTNAAGEAVLTYEPTWTGHQGLVATATTAAGTTLASATTSLNATSAARPFAGTVQAVRPDASIGRAVNGGLLAILAVLWITLIAVVVRVNLGLTARRG
ncbi:MAG: hypothetical protein ACYCXA_11345 [Actinomycetes bacterium]